MSAHTSGPWRVVNDAQGPCMVMHPTLNGVAIANLGLAFVPSNGYHDADPAERIANTRLIAAAPDLLAALLLLQAEVVASGNADSDDFGWPRALSASHAAIAKATGDAA